MILTALAHYTEACDKASFSTRPVVFGVHYDIAGTMLGHLSVPRVTNDNHLGHAAHGVLSPFAVSPDVVTSFSVTDAMARLGAARSLFVTRLTAVPEGVNMNHWRVPYGMDDRGHVIHGAPEPATDAPTAVLAAISSLASQRLSGQAIYHFDEAFRASVVFLDLLAQGRLHEATGEGPGGKREGQ